MDDLKNNLTNFMCRFVTIDEPWVRLTLYICNKKTDEAVGESRWLCIEKRSGVKDMSVFFEMQKDILIDYFNKVKYYLSNATHMALQHGYQKKKIIFINTLGSLLGFIITFQNLN